MYKTEEVIEKIVAAIIGNAPAPRQAYYLRESLHHLVRLAQREKTAEVSRCLTLSIGDPTFLSFETKKRSRAATRKVLNSLRSRQRSLNFEIEILESRSVSDA